MLFMGAGLDTCSVHNSCVRQENGLEAQYSQNQNNYANYFNKLKEIAQVPAMYSADLEKVYKGAISRPVRCRRVEGDHAVHRRAQPQLRLVPVHEIQQVIEAGRNSFEADQKTLLDKRRVYQNTVGEFPGSMVAGMMGFPKVDLKKYDPVINEETAAAFATKKAGPISLSAPAASHSMGTELHVLTSTKDYAKVLEGRVKGREVLELGTGTGVLTQLLLDAGAKAVLGYEIVPDLVYQLQERIRDPRMSLRVADYTVIDLDWIKEHPGLCLVSNPAYSTLPFIVKEILPLIKSAILMVPSRCVEEFKCLGFQEVVLFEPTEFEPIAAGLHHLMLRGFGVKAPARDRSHYFVDLARTIRTAQYRHRSPNESRSCRTTFPAWASVPWVASPSWLGAWDMVGAGRLSQSYPCRGTFELLWACRRCSPTQTRRSTLWTLWGKSVSTGTRPGPTTGFPPRLSSPGILPPFTWPLPMTPGSSSAGLWRRSTRAVFGVSSRPAVPSQHG